MDPENVAGSGVTASTLEIVIRDKIKIHKDKRTVTEKEPLTNFSGATW